MNGGYENVSEDTMISIYNQSVDGENLYGSCFGLCRRPIVSGNWSVGWDCGSRSMNGGMYSARVLYGGDRTARGCSEKKINGEGFLYPSLPLCLILISYD